MCRARSALLLCCWLLVGCSSDRDAMEKRLGSLREDITRLQADNDRLGERIGRLEVTSTPATASTAGATQAAAGATQAAAGAPSASAALERPPLKVIRLVPQDAAAVSPGVGTAEVTADESPDAPGTRPVIRLRGKADSREEGGSGPAVARRSPSSQEEP